jgi:hypothetical protein
MRDGEDGSLGQLGLKRLLGPALLVLIAAVLFISPSLIWFCVAGIAVGAGISAATWVWPRFRSWIASLSGHRVDALIGLALLVGAVATAGLLRNQTKLRVTTPAAPSPQLQFKVNWQGAASWRDSPERLVLQQTMTIDQSEIAQAVPFVTREFLADLRAQPRLPPSRLAAAIGNSLTATLREQGWKREQDTNLSLAYAATKPMVVALKHHGVLPAEETNDIPPPALISPPPNMQSGQSVTITIASLLSLTGVVSTPSGRHLPWHVLVPFILTPESQSALTVDRIPSGAVGGVFPAPTHRSPYSGGEQLVLPLDNGQNFELDVRSPVFRIWAMQRFVDLTKQAPFGLFVLLVLALIPSASRALLKRVWRWVKARLDHAPAAATPSPPVAPTGSPAPAPASVNPPSAAATPSPPVPPTGSPAPAPTSTRPPASDEPEHSTDWPGP